MFTSIFQLILGLGLLILGGDFLVKSAVNLARRFNLTSAVISLTVIAFGTSAPELITSIMAAIKGSSSIAIGNVIGSNIFNILIIVGISSIIVPNVIEKTSKFFETPFLIFCSILMILFGWDLLYSFWEGILFVVILLIFISFSIYYAKIKSLNVSTEDFELTNSKFLVEIVILLLGFFNLILGANIALEGAIKIGQLIGISERIIGLTIVSVGTGLPELTTSIIAVVRGRTDIAIANVVGSNIINILAVIGLTSIIVPINFPVDLINNDSIWMLIITLLFFVFMWNKKNQIGRFAGVFFILIYIAYLINLTY